MDMFDAVLRSELYENASRVCTIGVGRGRADHRVTRRGEGTHSMIRVVEQVPKADLLTTELQYNRCGMDG